MKKTFKIILLAAVTIIATKVIEKIGEHLGNKIIDKIKTKKL